MLPSGPSAQAHGQFSINTLLITAPQVAPAGGEKPIKWDEFLYLALWSAMLTLLALSVCNLLAQVG